MKTMLFALCLLAAQLLVPAQAQVSGTVGVSSSMGSVLLTEGAQGTVTWTVTAAPMVSAGAGAGPGTSTPVQLLSTQVVFRADNGTVLGSQARTFSRHVTSAGTFVFTESLRLPASMAYQAYRLGSQGIVIERTFTGGATVTGALLLPLSNSPGSGVQVSRIDLVLSNQTRASLVPQGDELHALARISLQGNGWLDVRWEIADAAGLQGEPLYRPLRSWRQYVGGALPLELQSPPLPTQRLGRYLVRLSVHEPLASPQPTPLLYQVMGAPSGADLVLQQPADGTLLGPDTPFRWSPVAGASAYLLELLPEFPDPMDRTPDTPARSGAALVPADSTELQLSALVRHGLQSGQRYRWRVLALDREGRTLAQSTPRRIQMP